MVYTHPFRNECCRNLVPDVFEPLIELGTDTTRTIASLLFSGSAARFPDIKWIPSHAGDTAPFLMQRFTYYFAARKDLQQRLPEGPTYYLSRFYYDTANAMTIHPLASLTKVVARRRSSSDRLSLSDRKKHGGRPARGRPVQRHGFAGDRARQCRRAHAAIQGVTSSAAAPGRERSG